MSGFQMVEDQAVLCGTSLMEKKPNVDYQR